MYAQRIKYRHPITQPKDLFTTHTIQLDLILMKTLTSKRRTRKRAQSTQTPHTNSNLKPQQITKHSTVCDPPYFITHFNGRRMVVCCKGSNIRCYPDLQMSICPTHTRTFADYTNPPHVIRTARRASYTLPHCQSLFVGYDTEPMNTHSTQNILFGRGNTLIVIDSHNHVYLIGAAVEQLHTIRGNITGYISPIGNSDIPNPMLFTTSHLYSWCGSDITEYPRPTDRRSSRIIRRLCNARHPADVQSYQKEVDWFVSRYECTTTTHNNPRIDTTLRFKGILHM